MILIIDNYDSFTYNLSQLILNIAAEEVIVMRNDKITLAEIELLKPKCIVLSPGPGHPKDANLCVDIVKSSISKANSREAPILGVCLGHQIIASVYGGGVTRAKYPLHGKGRTVMHKNARLFHNLPSIFTAARYNSLIVSEDLLPEALVVDARDEHGEIMAISHKSKPIYGIQFHPESILTPLGKNIMQNFLEIAHVKTIS